MTSIFDQPIRLFPIFQERVWGRESLAPYFPGASLPDVPTKHRIGEVWFTFKDNATSAGIPLGQLLESKPEILGTAADPRYPGICPLLVKLLFTTERLSVQVHPDDAYAQQNHGSLGKTEAWYVMEAEPSAEVALGFREWITPQRLRDASRSSEIEKLLDWRRVKAGDVIYTPAGTVHAIGAGLTICEIQENSDITYRLYDYGRPRELHLEHGVKVSDLGPHQHHSKPIALTAWRRQLNESPYFRIEHLQPVGRLSIEANLPYYLLLICLRGSGSIGNEEFKTGECWLVPSGNARLEVFGADSEWILTYTAERPTEALNSR